MLERRQLGHYRLIQRIGGGGMGEIYLAQDTRIERQVALKMVRAEVDPYPNAAATADMQRLFLREMQAITRLDHPRILPLYDFGEERDGNHVITYMVMPYRPEGSLTDWLQKRGSSVSLSFRDVAHFIGQAAEALQHAHDHELVHQDVKPSNFLVRNHSGYPLPDLLLSDFGIARVLSTTSTASQNVRGTPTSMAPEQWQGNPGPATDQYALAIMAYVLLVGRPPFNGRMEQLLLQHLSSPPAPPSTLNPAIPGELDTVILTALNKEPARRFGSIAAFARAFQQAASVPGLARPLPVNSATPPQSVPPQQPAAPPSPQMPISLSSEAPPPPPYYPPSGASSPRLPVAPPAPLYPAASISPLLPPTIAPNSPTPFPATPQQPMVLPPVQPYGQSGQPYEYPVQPYAQPVQPYGQSSQPYAQSVQPYEYPITGSPQPPAGTGQPARSNRLLWSIAAACLAVVLIIAGVIGVNTYQNHEANLNASATASAQNTQNTAEAQGTISIQGTQTAITSQATADAQATVNAQASATAQAVASNPYPSYMSGGGSLALLDSLQAAGNWQALSDTSFGGSCQFTAGAFHVLQTQTNRFYYCENNTSFENFAMEVQMQIIRGDCGGVVIRANGAKLYYFTVCANGGYEVWKYLDSTGSNASELTSGSNGAISGNDTVGILANGSSLTLYINQRQVAVVNDGTFASGTIALVAEDDTHPTEVAYSNLRIWV